MKHSLTIFGSLVAILLLTGCNPNQQTTNTTLPTAQPTAVEETPLTDDTIEDDTLLPTDDSLLEDETATKGALKADDQVDYTVNMQNFSFSPNKLTIKAGSTIKVKVVNKGGLHDFVIDELNVKSKQVQAPNEQIIEITAPANVAGKSYEFYCSVGQHRAQGMVGTLTVTK